MLSKSAVEKCRPPLPNVAIGHEGKPGCQLDVGIDFRILNELLKLRLSDKAGGLDFLGVGIHVNVLLQEEDVVDLMLTPDSV